MPTSLVAKRLLDSHRCTLFAVAKKQTAVGWRNDWDAWWERLDRDDRRVVRAWLAEHSPPPIWQDGAIAYAFTEMPFAPRGSRR